MNFNNSILSNKSLRMNLNIVLYTTYHQTQVPLNQGLRVHIMQGRHQEDLIKSEKHNNNQYPKMCSLNLKRNRHQLNYNKKSKQSLDLLTLLQKYGNQSIQLIQKCFKLKHMFLNHSKDQDLWLNKLHLMSRLINLLNNKEII